VLYTRWESVDKNVGNNQSLWRVHPDGTSATHVAGAHWGPITFWEPRQVPGSDKIVCTLAPHMPIAVGPIALVDPHDVGRSPAKFTNLTPELPPPHHFSWHRNDVGYSCNPYPLSEKYFVVSYSYDPDPRAPRGYGLYLLDRWGNRDLLYRDPNTSCFEAMPAVARTQPPVLPPAAASESPPATGTFILLDVYRGLTGVPRGEVKYLRVIEEVPKPVSAECRGYGLQHPLISKDGNFAVKRVLGTVPVEEDGSASFEAPAGKALYFSALNADFLEVQRMRSFTHLAPGQTITCVGCHEDRRTAPPNGLALAVRRPPSAIEPPPEGVHAPDFAHDVQPVLDRHCVRCHAGNRVEGGVDLSGDATNLFNVAYETLTAKYVSYVNIYSSATLALRPPKHYGSHASKLMEVLRGKHQEYVKLPKDDWRRLATWIDCNAPYYGTYRYSRPGTIGGRELVSGNVEADLVAVFRRRCASCHGQETGRVKQVRVPGVERSAVLRAPLAKEAGGSGKCGKPVFAGTDDSDYQAMLAALRSLADEVRQNPREDMLPQRPPVADEKAPYRYR
jgi:mono/diheme cytochrome c family protein